MSRTPIVPYPRLTVEAAFLGQHELLRQGDRWAVWHDQADPRRDPTERKFLSGWRRKEWAVHYARGMAVSLKVAGIALLARGQEIPIRPQTQTEGFLLSLKAEPQKGSASLNTPSPRKAGARRRRGRSTA